jgi:glycosyltransferase involved in cell wall biosynthesis
MRVLHLSSLYPPPAVGGAEKVVKVLAEAQAAAGVQSAVAYLSRSPQAAAERNGVQLWPLQHRNPLWIEDSANHSGPLRKLNKLATLCNLLTLSDLSKLLDEWRPDVLHSHSMVELPPAMWQAARERGIAVVHTLHDYDLLCIRAALFMDGRRCETRHHACRAFSAVKRLFHGNIDHVVAVTRSVMQTHLEHGFFTHLPADRRHVVWNPVPLDSLRARTPAQTDAGRPFTFGFMGRLVAEKGIDVLLRACRQLPPRGWRLKVAGKAPGDDGELRALAKGLPVEFVGYVDSAEFMSSVDVLVVPSVWMEPFGLTVVEAFAAGLPVIGSDRAGIAELVGAVDPAALVPAGDADALAVRMAQLVAAGRDCLQRPDGTPVLDATRPETVVSRYLDVYERAIADSRRVAGHDDRQWVGGPVASPDRHAS